MDTDFPIGQFLSIGRNNFDADPSLDVVEIMQKLLQSLKSKDLNKKNLSIFEKEIISSEMKDKVLQITVNGPFIKSMTEKYFLNDMLDELISLLDDSYNIELIAYNPLIDTPYKAILDIVRQEKSSLPDPSIFAIRKNEKFKSVNDLRFKIQADKVDGQESAQSTYIKHCEALGSVIIDPNKNFDNFIVGGANRIAHSIALSIAANPGKGNYSNFYIYGPSGIGKTHLLHAIANKVQSNFPSYLIAFTSARGFMREMIDFIRDNKLNEFQKKYTERIDLLIIDDLHELTNKKGTQNEFFHIFNILKQQEKQLIFTSDRSPHEITGLEERIKSRLQWGLVVDMTVPDLETRAAILKKKAISLDFPLSDEMIIYIADHVKENVRELEGSLLKLLAYAETMKSHIDMELIKKIIGEGKSTSLNDHQVDMELIAKTVSSYFDIPLADLISKSRNKNIARIRHLGMLISQKKTNCTLQEIGDFYGQRSHSTVVHGIKKIEEGLIYDDKLKEDYQELEIRVSK